MEVGLNDTEAIYERVGEQLLARVTRVFIKMQK